MATPSSTDRLREIVVATQIDPTAAKALVGKIVEHFADGNHDGLLADEDFDSYLADIVDPS